MFSSTFWEDSNFGTRLQLPISILCGCRKGCKSEMLPAKKKMWWNGPDEVDETIVYHHPWMWQAFLSRSLPCVGLRNKYSLENSLLFNITFMHFATATTMNSHRWAGLTPGKNRSLCSACGVYALLSKWIWLIEGSELITT